MKKAIVIGGFAGVGKTSFGKAICNQLEASVFIDKDTLSSVFVDALVGKNDRSSKRYLETIRPLEYQVLYSTAKENIQLGNIAIIVAPFIKELQSDEFKMEFASKLNLDIYEILYLWISCPEYDNKVMLIKRESQRDELKLNNWNQYYENLLIKDLDKDIIQIENLLNESPFTKALAFVKLHFSRNKTLI